MAGAALILATGGAVRELRSTESTAPVGTTVIDLVLPSPAATAVADSGGLGPKLPSASPRAPEAGPIEVPLPNLRTRMGTRVEDPAAGSPPPTAAAQRPDPEVAAATASPSPIAQPDPGPGGVISADAESAAASPDPAPEPVTPTAAEMPLEVASIAPGDIEAGVPAPVEAPSAPNPDHRVTVRRGDSLYLIFKRLGLPQRDLALMTGSKPLAKKLARISPNQAIEFYLDADSRLVRLVLNLDGIRSLHVSRDGDSFAFEEVVEPAEVSAATAAGTIESSLFVAGQRSGLSDNIIMQMAEIFAWDVDFALDIRAGDRFALIYEEQYKGDRKIGEGPIVAAEFVNRGRRIRAVRYVYPSGRADYFSADGRSMRKQFLRTPVNFTRISSRFSASRRHPVLHRMRAHRGVDYAAPRGTVVKASGDGRVIFAGRNGGYGRTVILKHGSTYSTLYAHLSRFAKGIRSGKRVVQGQTIGYVGSTGLATGPHLHYEFRVRGVHRDPLKVKLPDAAPLAGEYMAEFGEKAKPLLASLELIGSTTVAAAEQSGAGALPASVEAGSDVLP